LKLKKQSKEGSES